jgi:hypothetical protein
MPKETLFPPPALHVPITIHKIPSILYYKAYKTFDPVLANLNNETNIKTVQAPVAEEVTISFPQPSTTILQYYNWPPRGTSPLYRHVTIDFGIPIFGSMEAIMDSGEIHMLKASNVIVQRNILHA